MSLRSSKFPHPAAQVAWDSLIGLDDYKDALLDTLELLLVPERFTAWLTAHHSSGLKLAEHLSKSTPLIVLSGDVGCGKSAMATCVGQPLSKRLDALVTLLEAPTDIRGTGLVGEMSTRIGDTFSQAVREAPRRGYALLLLDEGDDVATSREQLQAHHEDRAGVNALIKGLDSLAGNDSRVAVFLCTNRGAALDPALLRRAALHLQFARPQGPALVGLLEAVLSGLELNRAAINRIVKELPSDPPYTPSDLIHRVGRRAVLSAYREQRSVGVDDILAAVRLVPPTPVFGDEPVGRSAP